MVTDQERQLIRRIFAGGPAILLEEGYNLETARAFLAREDVREEWSLLDREYANADAINARTKFVVRRQLSRLKDGAVAVLARALVGPNYVRDNQGNILRDAVGRPLMTDPGPTSTQVSAAQTVLDRLGIVADATIERVDGASLNTMLAQGSDKGKLSIPLNPNLKTPEEQSLARERLRTIMSELVGLIPSARAKLDGAPFVEAKGNVVTTKPAKKRKSRSKKATDDTVSKGT